MQTRTADRKDTETGETIGPSLTHLGFVNSVAYSADGTTMVTGGNDHCVQLWSTATGRRIAVQLEHPTAVDSVAISANGRTVVSADRNGTVCVWEASPGNLLRTVWSTGWKRAAEFSPDGRSILIGASDSGAKICDVATGIIKGGAF